MSEIPDRETLNYWADLCHAERKRPEVGVSFLRLSIYLRTPASVEGRDADADWLREFADSSSKPRLNTKRLNAIATRLTSTTAELSKLREENARLKRQLHPRCELHHKIFTVAFHGGPCAGELRDYPKDQGKRIVLPCENGSEVIYEKDTSEMAKSYYEETGRIAYECTFNGAALPLTEPPQ